MEPKKAMRKSRYLLPLLGLAIVASFPARQLAQETQVTEIKITPLEEEKKEERKEKQELSEFTFTVSSWSWNLLKKPIEDVVGGILEDNLKEELLKKIEKDFPEARIRSYSQSLEFDSGGSDFGFEARWYPAGRKGSFSLGFAFHKSTMRVGFPLVTVKMEVESSAKPGVVGTVDARAENVQLEIEPLSFHFVFCWDIVPRWTVHPFFSVGLGLFSIRAFEEGLFTASYDATLDIPNVKRETWEDDIDKTVREFINESSEGDTKEKLTIPILPILQVNVGIAGRISGALAFRVFAGFYDGFRLGGGVTWRL